MPLQSRRFTNWRGSNDDRRIIHMVVHRGGCYRSGCRGAKAGIHTGGSELRYGIGARIEIRV